MKRPSKPATVSAGVLHPQGDEQTLVTLKDVIAGIVPATHDRRRVGQRTPDALLVHGSRALRPVMT